jgi:hypothetical protein
MDMDFATIRRTTIIALFADDELAGMFTHGKDSCSCRARHCADARSAATMVSVCRGGLRVMDGGGFFASLDEFFKACANY